MFLETKQRGRLLCFTGYESFCRSESTRDKCYRHPEDHH
jgi:hypothetical protein